MTYDRLEFRRDLEAALHRDISAADLGDVVAKHYPDLDVFRENDDLVLVGGGTHRLLVRRVGPDSFRISDIAAASGSTNLLDLNESPERSLDALVDEIAAFAAL